MSCAGARSWIRSARAPSAIRRAPAVKPVTARSAAARHCGGFRVPDPVRVTRSNTDSMTSRNGPSRPLADRSPDADTLSVPPITSSSPDHAKSGGLRIGDGVRTRDRLTTTRNVGLAASVANWLPETPQISLIPEASACRAGVERGHKKRSPRGRAGPAGDRALRPPFYPRPGMAGDQRYSSRAMISRWISDVPS
jgi:hypothetical protein